MRIFLDTANVEDIVAAAATGVLAGVTTNPSLLAREGAPFEETISAIRAKVPGLTMLFEVVATDTAGMVAEARQLAKLSENVVVKIPMVREGIVAIKQLVDEGITTAATLVFSVNQAVLAACAGASYVAPFVGRLDDVGDSGLDLVRAMKQTLRAQHVDTQVLAASIRSPRTVSDLFAAGCDVVTMPPKVFDAMFNHPLTDKGLAKFLEDAASV